MASSVLQTWRRFFLLVLALTICVSHGQEAVRSGGLVSRLKRAAAQPAFNQYAFQGVPVQLSPEEGEELREAMEREEDRVLQRERRRVLTVAGVEPYLCDAAAPCPLGYECLDNPMAPGVRSCFTGAPQAKRPGRCPPPAVATLLAAVSGHTACLFHQDCVEGQRCCPAGAARYRVCSRPLADVRRPHVHVLLAGSGGGEAGHRLRSATVVLVQSAGKTILFDTGTVADKPAFVRSLRSLGLSLADVDFVAVSHGHPDHFGNAGMLPAAPQSFYDVNVLNQQLTVKWKPGERTPRYFVFNDRNVEIVKSEGHTLQDTAMIVRNVPGKGTVVLSGDAFLYENDHLDGSALSAAQDRALLSASRRRLLCLADWIAPGHGTMFQVTQAHRQAFHCDHDEAKGHL